MTRLLTAGLAALALAVAGIAGAGSLGDDDPKRAAATTSTVGDVRGPCDEAEHRNDPRCTGAGEDDRTGRGGDDHDNGTADRGGDDDDNDNDNDDRSGSNSGRH